MFKSCNFKELSLIQNATFGMNFVAHGLDLKKGDEVINTGVALHSLIDSRGQK